MILPEIQHSTPRYRCVECLILFDKADMVDGKCPRCLSDKSIKTTCSMDKSCNCPDNTSYLETYCPVCGARTCPCGSHDITIVSRVTGYLSDVSGWNAAKQQEFKDRVRSGNVEQTKMPHEVEQKSKIHPR